MKGSGIIGRGGWLICRGGCCFWWSERLEAIGTEEAPVEEGVGEIVLLGVDDSGIETEGTCPPFTAGGPRRELPLSAGATGAEEEGGMGGAKPGWGMLGWFPSPGATIFPPARGSMCTFTG